MRAQNICHQMLLLCLLFRPCWVLMLYWKLYIWPVSSFSIALHRCTQLASHWVYVLERNIFGAFSIEINCRFAPFHIDFSSVGTKILYFIIYRSEHCLLKKRKIIVLALSLPPAPALTLFLLGFPFCLSALVILDKPCNSSCYWRPKPNS